MWGRVLWVRVCECVRRDRQRERKKFSKFSTFFLFFFFSTNFFFSLSSLFEYSFSNYKPNYILHNGWRRSMFIQQYWERESENGSYWLWIVMIWFDGLIIVFLFPLLYIYIFTCLLPSIQRITMQLRSEIHFQKLMRWIHKINQAWINPKNGSNHSILKDDVAGGCYSL